MSAPVLCVCLVTGIYPPAVGGAASYAKNFVQGATAQGHAVPVVSFAAHPRQVPGVVFLPERLPYPVKVLATLQTALTVGADASIFFATDPIVAGFPALLAAKLKRKPFILRLGGHYAWENAIRLGWIPGAVSLEVFVSMRKGVRACLLEWLQSYVISQAEVVIVPSEFLCGVYVAAGVPLTKLQVIRNGVSEVFRPPQKKPVRGGKKTLLVVSRLYAFKRVGAVIEAVAAGLRSPPTRLVIAGDGDELSVLKALAARLGVDVDFRGPRSEEEIAALMREVDALALYSSSEGAPNVLLEAMASGLPVVASDLPSVREFVEDNRTGLLANPADPSDLRRQLERVLTDEALAGRLAVNGLQEARKYSWESTLRQTLAVFRKALEARP